VGLTAVEDLRAEEKDQVTRAEVDAAHAEAGTDVEIVEAEGGVFQLLVGGKAPTTEQVRLLGGAIECAPPDGGWRKGSKYVLRVEVECCKKAFVDQRDGKTGQVTGCRDEAGLRISGVRLTR
jgi:hypothetical protein